MEEEKQKGKMIIENGTEMEMVAVDSDSSGGEEELPKTNGGATKCSSCLSHRFKLPPFVQKIYEIVEKEETRSIVSWSSSGTSFVIWERLSFEAQILPSYFRHNNFQSFVCQLNSYGFKKLNWDRWEFGNEYFRKGEPHLLENIKRRDQISKNKQPAASKRGPPISAQITSSTSKTEKKIETLSKEHDLLKQEAVKLKEHQVTLEAKIASFTNEAMYNQQKIQKMLKLMLMITRIKQKEASDSRLPILVEEEEKPDENVKGHEKNEVESDKSDNTRDFSIDNMMELVSNEKEMGEQCSETFMSLDDLVGESPEWAEYVRHMREEAGHMIRN